MVLFTFHKKNDSKNPFQIHPGTISSEGIVNKVIIMII